MKKLFRRLAAVLCVLALCLTPVSALSVEEAIGLLEQNYIDELPPAVYEATTLDELFTALGDPYTYYMDDAEYEEFTSVVENERTVSGIGATIEYTGNGIRITSVLAGGGAEEAGLAPDDLIVAISGVSCIPAGEQHRAMLIGEPGTYADFTVLHPDGTTQDYHIERRTITLRNTTVTRSGDVGSIDCSSFGSQTAEYFYEGLAQNEDARLWVVDLRDNTGGYADSAVGALGAFSGYGPKLYYRLGDGSSFYTLYLGGRLTDKPAIVLVNALSASASEILSGGVRAENVGIVIGSRTYGKGSAQIVLDKERYPELFDGGSLKVTVYRFYCSDGNTTDKIGVVPTLLVDDAYAADAARLLTAEPDKKQDQLRVLLNGCEFYVNLSEATGEDSIAAFVELLAALPPDVELLLTRANGEKEALLPAELLEQYGGVSRGFTDVSASPYEAEIDTLGVYGVLQGVGDGRFAPGAALTRAGLCAMLSQALNVTAKGTGGYSDVAEDAWYAGSVAAVSRLGFVSGLGDARFDPNGTLTQEQFIAVMGRLARFLNFRVDDYALALDETELAADEALASLAPWARVGACVMTRSENGNMLYAPLETLDLSSAVTREQAAATLCRTFKTLGILSY